MKSKTRSPLKDKPLRMPGQSVAEEREELLDNTVSQPLMLALFLVLLAGLEWYRLYFNMTPSPVIFSIGAGLGIGYAALRIYRNLPKLRSLRQAIEGEKVVGQFLERLRLNGFQVFHDVVGDGFNVDHVLIGPPGVFTVETKTWSKPAFGNAEVVFDGLTLKIGSFAPDRDPIVQAKAQASWLKQLLSQSTGRKFETRPVIVFPGWFVANSGGFRDLWVLEPKALPSFLQNEPARLSPEEVNLASFHLSRLIRATERARSPS
ncbi:NERD domain-containing protein [Variovorax sp. RKNM96]|uniref:nuclease-related domain-containing protein n=1 Tax=Variovorax sp. RKNM96 TaxID=2681552 RepID=UPI00197D616B|nr:nuclease-related domain-containing protein [Variovorax sp. RKNM96]QSI28905.1 NERD domain-containing protein [Variovorax sp. RKNM96]